jgi:hypothetical protein
MRLNAKLKETGAGVEATTWYRGEEQRSDSTPTATQPTTSSTTVSQNMPGPALPTDQLMAMFQGFFTQQQQLQLSQLNQQPNAQFKYANKPKRKRDDESEGNSSESDEDVKVEKNTPNTARRILWQRGHSALLPSTVRGIIAEATVRTLAEARAPLQELGFAIIEDMTDIYAPKNRCTKEQMDFIHKCK